MDPNPRTAQARVRNEPLCLLFYAHDVLQAAVLVDPHVISKPTFLKRNGPLRGSGTLSRSSIGSVIQIAILEISCELRSRKIFQPFFLSSSRYGIVP
jgi:hypothetical protein